MTLTRQKQAIYRTVPLYVVFDTIKHTTSSWSRSMILHRSDSQSIANCGFR